MYEYALLTDLTMNRAFVPTYGGQCRGDQEVRTRITQAKLDATRALSRGAPRDRFGACAVLATVAKVRRAILSPI